MTKPRLVKVRALFYVFQQVIKKRLRLFLTQPLLLVSFKFGAQEWRCGGVPGRYFFRGAFGHYVAASGSSVRTHVYHIVGHSYHVEVVFDYKDGIAPFDQSVEYVHQRADIVEVKTCCRLIEYEQGVSCVAFGELCCKLHALVLSAGQGGGGLPEFHVSESDVLQNLYLFQYRRYACKELHGLVDSHIEHVGHGFAFESYFECFAVVAFSVAFLSRHEHVREEVHLYRLVAVAIARLAASACHIERESPRLVASYFCFRQVHE